MEATTADFPYVRAVVAVRKRTIIKERLSEETRYFISSMDTHERIPARWLQLIRGHWAGVEIRNHWRRDAIWMEDKTRSRNENIVGALALIRNSLLAVVGNEADRHGSLPALTEALCTKTHLVLKLIRKNL
ncbi:MAG TPA: hypothetical protein PKE26_17175 [Kiritimatiellia bacterium]|nr:hypothetical protein [Kiritimatiellia bacterium]HMP00832.1 hypothetical protein [Kiritimatiellia bacterium]